MKKELIASQVFTAQACPELNAAIAKWVMKWEVKEDKFGCWKLFDHSTNLQGNELNWFPSSDVAHDYDVLEYVQENWKGQKFRDFQEQLNIVMYRHTHTFVKDAIPPEHAGSGGGFFFAAFYQPGDYGRGALAVELILEWEKKSV